MQFHEEKRLVSGNAKLKQSDLQLPYMGTSEDRTLYVRNVPDTWDKWKLLHVFRRFGRIDNIKIIRKHEDLLACAFIHMMSVADANSVISATAQDNGKMHLPGLSKPLKIQFLRQKGQINGNADLSADVDREVERMKSYFSIIDKPELFITGGYIRKPILYSERLHRHAYLPCGKPVEVELIKPITKYMDWPLVFYVVTKTHMCEEENLLISNDELDSQITAHFERAAPVTHVVKNELLVAAPKEPHQIPLRCRIVEELDDSKVLIYALDLGETVVVKISELKAMSDYLASIPARATPCVLYGIANPASTFATVATDLLENISHLVILVVSFEGAIAHVRAFPFNGSPMSEVAKVLSDKNLCEYKPPSNIRRVYPREAILSLRK